MACGVCLLYPAAVPTETSERPLYGTAPAGRGQTLSSSSPPACRTARSSPGGGGGGAPTVAIITAQRNGRRRRSMRACRSLRCAGQVRVTYTIPRCFQHGLCHTAPNCCTAICDSSVFMFRPRCLTCKRPRLSDRPITQAEGSGGGADGQIDLAVAVGVAVGEELLYDREVRRVVLRAPCRAQPSLKTPRYRIRPCSIRGQCGIARVENTEESHAGW
eukprot:SAG11_NODE_2997_length_2781_cov_2.921700_4_plen_217_part_00